MKTSIRILLILMLFFVPTVHVRAEESRLYQNDRLFCGQNTLLSVQGEEYAALSFFDGFEGICLCEENGNFCLSAADGRFLSFLVARPDTLLSDSLTLLHLPVPEHQGERFLPLSQTAQLLGLSVTTLARDGTRHVRLSDGQENTELAALCALYDARS